MADQWRSPHADSGDEAMSHPTAEGEASEGVAALDDWFWDRNPTLLHIRQAAHARGVSAPCPWP